MNVRHWRTLERHPLSAAYTDLSGRAWDLYVANLKKNGVVDGRKVVMYEGQVIDGWQLLRACIETDVKPDFKELRLPKDMTVQEWIETVNDHRRHETQEKAMARVGARRERAATARVEEGKSLRTIAEEEGVSEATIRDDLEKVSTAQGCAVEPPCGKITGKDGKERPATMPPKPAEPEPEPAPPPRCGRCQRAARVGQEIPKNCPDCKALREPKPSSSRGRSSRNGAPVFNDAEVTNLIGKLIRMFDTRADVYGKGPRHQACLDAMDKVLAAFTQWQIERDYP